MCVHVCIDEWGYVWRTEEHTGCPDLPLYLKFLLEIGKRLLLNLNLTGFWVGWLTSKSQRASLSSSFWPQLGLQTRAAIAHYYRSSIDIQTQSSLWHSRCSYPLSCHPSPGELCLIQVWKPTRLPFVSWVYLSHCYLLIPTSILVLFQWFLTEMQVSFRS